MRRKRKAEAPPEPHSCPAQQRLTAVTRLLLDRSAGGHQQVLIGQVLELAIPGWKDPATEDPRMDPMFGTMPVDAASYPDVSTDPG
jgi:hypothetical protein